MKMKHSRRIAVDFFIKECINSGNASYAQIVKEARKAEKITTEEVEHLLDSQNSKAYEKYINTNIGGGECLECSHKVLYDSTEEEFYCPVCES